MDDTKLDAYLTGAKRPVLMAHALLGFPSVERSRDVIDGLADGGAGILELQIPFSDPLADGPTIMLASEAALRAGFQMKEVFPLIAHAAKRGVPVVVMSYLNPILQYGIERFVVDATRSGAVGFIVPDAPTDTTEGAVLRTQATKNGAAVIEVVSPGVPLDRLKYVGAHAQGFVYSTTRQGITGADSLFYESLEQSLEEIRRAFSVPLALGFGIKTHDDYAHAAKLADIVVAGSVFVEAVGDASNPRTAAMQAVQKVRGL